MFNLTPEQLIEAKAYRKVVLIGLFFMVLGIIFYHLVEHLSWLDSAYFTVITLATVGYGDIVPHTPAGKIFTIFYVFIGIVLFVAVARIILQHVAMKNYQRQHDKANGRTKK